MPFTTGCDDTEVAMISRIWLECQRVCLSGCVQSVASIAALFRCEVMRAGSLGGEAPLRWKDQTRPRILTINRWQDPRILLDDVGQMAAQHEDIDPLSDPEERRVLHAALDSFR